MQELLQNLQKWQEICICVKSLENAYNGRITLENKGDYWSTCVDWLRDEDMGLVKITMKFVTSKLSFCAIFRAKNACNFHGLLVEC